MVRHSAKDRSRKVGKAAPNEPRRCPSPSRPMPRLLPLAGRRLACPIGACPCGTPAAQHDVSYNSHRGAPRPLTNPSHRLMVCKTGQDRGKAARSRIYTRSAWCAAAVSQLDGEHRPRCMDSNCGFRLHTPIAAIHDRPRCFAAGINPKATSNWTPAGRPSDWLRLSTLRGKGRMGASCPTSRPHATTAVPHIGEPWAPPSWQRPC